MITVSVEFAMKRIQTLVISILSVLAASPASAADVTDGVLKWLEKVVAGIGWAIYGLIFLIVIALAIGACVLVLKILRSKQQKKTDDPQKDPEPKP
jgi:hypothetical protein